jgi:pimeloyl-ACP methyl ester carboxylesterase
MEAAMAASPLTVVAVHGNGGGAFRFSLLPRPLADGVSLRAITLPGFEGVPLPAGQVTVATFADALAEELRAIDGDRVVLGHGIGGSIALDALGRHAGIAEGLILHAPVGARLDERLFPRIMSTPAVRSTVKWAIGAQLTRMIAGRLLFRGTPAGFTDRFLAEYRRCEAFGAMFEILTAEWFDALEPIDLPAAVLWGEHDRVLGSDQATEIEALAPGADRVVVPGWGHFPMIDDPGDYATRIAELARGLVAGS